MEAMKAMYLFTILTEDKPGVLARITGLLGARGENITSISAVPGDRKGTATITATVGMSEQHAEFVRRKILKLVSVLEASTQLHESEPSFTIDSSLWPPGPLSTSKKENHYCSGVFQGS
jgi:acetolactate synthase-1/3 small subunit